MYLINLLENKLLYVMKKFLVFLGAKYYPQGGIGDFICDFKTLEESTSTLFKEYGVSSTYEIGEGM